LKTIGLLESLSYLNAIAQASAYFGHTLPLFVPLRWHSQ
jgi:hypothetical protein